MNILHGMGFPFGVAPAEFGLLVTGLADFLRQIKNINTIGENLNFHKVKRHPCFSYALFGGEVVYWLMR